MKKISRSSKEVEKNQPKITNFFVKPSSNGGIPSTPVVSSRARTSKQKWIDDGDYADVEVLEPPPPSPKELVDLISSSDENDNDETTNSSANFLSAVKPEPVLSNFQDTNNSSSLKANPPSIGNKNTNEGDNDKDILSSSIFDGESSDDEILSQVDVEELVRLSQENKAEPATSQFHHSDSSGDEILSQIDVEEIIRSSQSSLNSKEDEDNNDEDGPTRSQGLLSPSIVSTPNKENRPSPSVDPSSEKIFQSQAKISPKSQLNKFSPIRHLRFKRSSSEASLDFDSVFASKTSPSFVSPSKSQSMQQWRPYTNSQSPAKRKLNFNSQTTTESGSFAGQARYFLRNFLTILRDVISDTFHAHLIHSEDHKLVQDFVALSLDAQHLYVRLFQRKWTWKPATKLNNKNKELPQDLTEACSELQANFFLDKLSFSNCGPLEDVLDILDLTKLTNLAKKMKLSPAKKTKEMLKEALLSTRKSQKTLFDSGGGRGDTASVILKHALSELGPTFRVSSESKLLFSRLFLLHAPPQYWEVENDQASNQLLIVLLNQMGQMEYPSYTVQKSTQIYPAREHLIQFHDAFSLHSDLVALSDTKQWAEMVGLAAQAKFTLQTILQEESVQRHDQNLPTFLKIYTAGSVLTHSLWLAVDGFQKLKRFGEANDLIRFLLEQLLYLPNYRGRWWERLVINSETHLRNSKEEVEILLLNALSDNYLKENHRLALSQRLEKIRATLEKKKTRGKKKKAELGPPSLQKKAKPKRNTGRRGGLRKKQYVDESEDEDDMNQTMNNVETQVISLAENGTALKNDDVVKTLALKNEIPTRTISGEKLDQGPGAMGKSIFISRKDSKGSNRMGSVEQFVIDYYTEHMGYTRGVHGEGSTVATIYGILFWDVIFCDNLPDAFHNRYQPYPLDLHFDEFYSRRKDLINEKLTLIRSVLSMDDLLGVVDEIWRNHQKKLCIVSWSLFEDDLDRLKSLMRAMGRKVIGDICERLAKNYRYYSSGFPDLVVWKETTQMGEEDLFGEEADHCDNRTRIEKNLRNDKVLFVEVKGPGDHLSEKQQLWLDYLLENGIPAEVCLVKAVSNKRIRLEK